MSMSVLDYFTNIDFAHAASDEKLRFAISTSELPATSCENKNIYSA